MKIFLIILFFIPVIFICQENQFNSDQYVNGILKSSSGIYLIINKGFIPISETDIYTEYYRQIYNDSTLVNPNTVLRSNFDLNIIPFLLPDHDEQQVNFSEPLKMGLFIRMNENGDLNVTEFTDKIIDSLLAK